MWREEVGRGHENLTSDTSVNPKVSKDEMPVCGQEDRTVNLLETRPRYITGLLPVVASVGDRKQNVQNVLCGVRNATYPFSGLIALGPLFLGKDPSVSPLA